MNMARYEQETLISFNEEEKNAGIYTHNKALRQKLAALARDRPEVTNYLPIRFTISSNR